MYEERADFPAARKVRQEVLAIRIKLRGEQHWQTDDARWALTRLDQLTKLTPDQWRRYLEMGHLMGKVEKLDSHRQYREALEPCQRAAEIRGALLGQENPDYADSLYWLGYLHAQTGDGPSAERLMRQARACKTLASVIPLYVARPVGFPPGSKWRYIE